MAHLDLHEQEQLNTLKYFWRDYGKYVFGILVVVGVAYFSNILWSLNSKKQAEKASVIYSKFVDAVATKNTDAVFDITTKLQHDYPKVEYTTYATLWAAKVAYKNQKADLAINYLNWVIANAKDRGLIQLAKLRLADIYVDQKKPNLALGVLSSKAEVGFQALFFAKQGDIYLANSDINHAKIMYKKALSDSTDDMAVTQMVQLKLDILGN